MIADAPVLRFKFN